MQLRSKHCGTQSWPGIINTSWAIPLQTTEIKPCSDRHSFLAQQTKRWLEWLWMLSRISEGKDAGRGYAFPCPWSLFMPMLQYGHCGLCCVQLLIMLYIRPHTGTPPVRSAWHLQEGSAVLAMKCVIHLLPFSNARIQVHLYNRPISLYRSTPWMEGQEWLTDQELLLSASPHAACFAPRTASSRTFNPITNDLAGRTLWSLQQW